jgi:site-specific DNA recombinase
MTKAKRLVVASKASKNLVDPEDGTAKRAVLYLRVSTPSQVNTDYNPEGISLPAQREACELKCSSLGADIVREFVEPGRSATSIENRPVFQEMMAWIKAERNVDYIVVYQFNRIFRNSIDAVISKRDLTKYGTRVVPTIMDLGEGPESDMVELIMHAVGEYQSKANGADIAYKMGAKARSGGTVGRAPLGYINARDHSEGRNIGIVVPDPERASLVTTGFELYATGNFTIEQLAEELTDRGLRTRGGRRAGGPIATSKLQAMLRDPYYTGIVTYKDETIPGRHAPLITAELFNQVQDVMDSRSGSGIRLRRHHHYLKGNLWCGYCHGQGRESRIIINRAVGRSGGVYFYFFCRGRQDHVCDSRYMDMEKVEDAILGHYSTLKFPAEISTLIRQHIAEVLADDDRTAKLLRQQLQSELDRLDRQEENLLDLAAGGDMPTPKVRTRLNTIAAQRNKVRRELDFADKGLAAGAALLEGALNLLADPQDLYRQCGPNQRRLLNQAIFEKLYIFDDEVVGHLLREPFDELIPARDTLRRWAAAQGATRPFEIDRDDPTKTGLLAAAFDGGGWSKAVMVEVMGFEPTASTLRKYTSQCFDQVLSEDFPSSSVAIPSGPLTI